MQKTYTSFLFGEFAYLVLQILCYTNHNSSTDESYGNQSGLEKGVGTR